MWIHTLNPVLLKLGPLQIRWYGLVYVIAFFLAVWWLHYARKKGDINFSKDDIWDFSFYVLVGILVGARLFEIFWEPTLYFSNLLNIFKIWNGGMSFHGGLVGAMVGAWLFRRKKHFDIWKIADIMSIPLILALALGRIANFINGELWGRAWDGALCVNFKNTGGGDVCRHPSTLYAAGKRFIVFGWLVWLNYWKKFTPGFIFWNFVFLEGLGRIIVDFYRENALFLGFSLGQWFSLIMVIAALWAFSTKYQKDWASFLKK
jgi:phosphatidylglycerol---prolipoprotein diacylglyceryl transferase